MKKKNVMRVLALCLAATVFAGMAGCGKITDNTNVQQTESAQTGQDAEKEIGKTAEEDHEDNVRLGSDNVGYFVLKNCNRNLYKYQSDGWTAEMTANDNIFKGSSMDSVWSNSGYGIEVKGDNTGIRRVIIANAGNSDYVDDLFENSGITDYKNILAEVLYQLETGTILDPAECEETELSGWKGMKKEEDGKVEAAFMKDFDGTYYFLYVLGKTDSFDEECGDILSSFTPSERKQTVGLFCTSGFGKNDMDSRKRFSDGRFGLLDAEKDAVTLYSVNLEEAGADMADENLTWITHGLQTNAGTFGDTKYSFGIYNKACEIRTSSMTVKTDADQMEELEIQEVNGRKCILIPVEKVLSVDGMKLGS
ncbi:MAG: hypothetical protein ACI4FX_10780 [Agathobacter sp.]